MGAGGSICAQECLWTVLRSKITIKKRDLESKRHPTHSSWFLFWELLCPKAQHCIMEVWSPWHVGETKRTQTHNKKQPSVRLDTLVMGSPHPFLSCISARPGDPWWICLRSWAGLVASYPSFLPCLRITPPKMSQNSRYLGVSRDSGKFVSNCRISAEMWPL